jgi:hypothetical protein
MTLYPTLTRDSRARHLLEDLHGLRQRLAMCREDDRRARLYRGTIAAVVTQLDELDSQAGLLD